MLQAEKPKLEKKKFLIYKKTMNYKNSWKVLLVAKNVLYKSPDDITLQSLTFML